MESQDIRVTISIGVAANSGSSDEIDPVEFGQMLIERADKALYMAKRAGRNRVTLASEPLKSEVTYEDSAAKSREDELFV